MSDAWAKVELYRWQHGELPPDDGTEKPLDICTGLRGMADAFNTDDNIANPYPSPFNVGQALHFAAREIERLKKETVEEIERAKRSCEEADKRQVDAWEQTKRAEKAEARVKELEAEIKQIKARVEEFEAELSRRTDSLASAASRYRRAEAARDESEARVMEIEEDLIELSARFRTQTDEQAG